MLSHVDYRAVGVAHEEATESPLLISDRIDNVCTRSACPFIYGVNVVDLDRDVGMDPNTGPCDKHTIEGTTGNRGDLYGATR